MLTAIRWTRRALDAILVIAIVAVVAIAAITVGAQVLGGRSLILAGGSMEPTMPKGSYVLTVPVADQTYHVGDIVTVAAPGLTPYTHRVNRLVELPTGRYIETKGDANAEPELVAVPYANVVGKVALFVPVLGYLAMLLTSPIGLAGFLFGSAFILCLIWLLEEFEQAECPICAAASAAGAAAQIAAAGAAVVAAASGVTLAVAEAVTTPTAEAAAVAAAAQAIGLDDLPGAAGAAVVAAASPAVVRGLLTVRHDNSGAFVRRQAARRAAEAEAVSAETAVAEVEPAPDASDRAEAA